MNLNHKSGVVKLMRFLIFGLLAAATVRGGQVITNSGWLDIGCVDSLAVPDDGSASGPGPAGVPDPPAIAEAITPDIQADRKSTRLNSSNGYISYAVFCL